MEPDNPLRPLFRPITDIKGIGEKSQPLVERVAGPYLRDILFHLPIRFITREVIDQRNQLISDQVVVLPVIAESQKRGRSRTLIHCSSPAGPVDILYFNIPAQRINKWFPQGEKRLISGKVAIQGNRVQFTHPDKILKPEQINELAMFEAVYELTQGLSANVYRKAIQASLSITPRLPEWIDAHLVKTKSWQPWHCAIHTIHGDGPDGRCDNTRVLVKQRLAYDELLSHQLTLSLIREARSGGKGPIIASPSALQNQVLQKLPFKLTQGQTDALRDIEKDFSLGKRMNRLLMGDVGSGKTVVAALAAACVLDAHLQVAVMAPTDILASQLFTEMRNMLEPHGVHVDYLSGKLTAAQRKSAILKASEGRTQVLCGTHALFQDSVRFKNLGFVIIDEQHRFGVQQRMRLAAKGQNNRFSPHMLLMSATPIPRTLVMAHYGDISISSLREKPEGRKPITTVAIDMQNWGRVQEKLGDAIAKGAQAYWICPLIEESAVSDLAAAENRHALLAQAFGVQNVGLIHGRLTADEKASTMAAFRDGRINVLVSTTVIEVGVNVPNATIMVIEQAERFGLAQLHQLRGRVGRGEKQSSCTLLYKKPLGENSRRRLQVMKETQDGFLIAEEDLNIRGSGDVIGTQQAGLPRFIFADAINDADLLDTAVQQTRYLRELDPSLSKTEQGKAARLLLRLFDRQQAIELIRTG